MDRPVEAVDLLGVEFPYQPGQVLVNVVLKDVLEFGAPVSSSTAT